MQDKISKEQFKQAQYAVKYLQPAVTALEQIDPWVFSGSLDAMDELTDCLDFLKLNLTGAMHIVSQGNQYYRQSDEELVSAAATRYFKIDKDVELAGRKQEVILKAYKAKTDELRKQRFSEAEISKIVTDLATEIEALNTVIESLRAENLKIQQFLADAPCFDESLLDGTQVFALKEHNRLMRTMIV